uniref:Hypotensin-1 n=2 Tax=Tityus TaxID=6886 RepID=NDBH1_TITSE|nr:RecName: Full=Hypotensin-1; AltName: Full=Anti-hypertensive peptide; AltName: Full=Hypotensin I; Short=TsHpt-I; AltName: Full=Tityustoxin-14 1; Short=Hypotensin toxin Ts14.1; Short=Ts14 1; Contains: RecName: Full=Hypotensin-3; AltName: Full=Hypotensin III; Short=TsHpt-III; AltName: Full=Toxin Ts14 3; Flags: Precursor [Tityus serrulatus]QPD99051.1 hypotensin toxin Ts14.1 [Tityus serrulatus]
MKMMIPVIFSILLLIFSLSSTAMSLEDEQENMEERAEIDFSGIPEDIIKQIKETNAKPPARFDPAAFEKSDD